MGKVRPALKKNKYKMPKHTFYTVYHYVLNYKSWKDEADALLGVKGMEYDGMPHGTSTGNPTESLAIKYGYLIDKCNVIEETAKECAGELYKWLLMDVTNEGITYLTLQMRHDIPISRDKYYEMRRRFYYLMAKKNKVF